MNDQEKINKDCPFCGGKVDPKGWLSDGGAW